MANDLITIKSKKKSDPKKEEKIIITKLNKLDKKLSKHDKDMKMGKSGNKSLEEGAHLQTGEHIEWKVVYDSLKDDYDKKDLEFVKYISWIGPVEVPLSSVDFSNSDQWAASQPGKDGLEKVNEFAEKMADQGQWKPVVLVNTPHNDEKMQVVDGRHRLMAAKKENMDVLSYVGQVGSLDKNAPYMQLHGSQITSKS